jgi:hypothetical protein
MTPEELQAELETVKAHNAKLLGELKVAKAKAKGAEIDPEEHARLQGEVEELRGKLSTAEKSGKAELEKLTKALSEKDGALQSYLIDGGLSDALAKAGVKPEFMDAAKALLKTQAQIKAEGGNYQALIGGKPLADAITEWTGGAGKHFIAATQNSGGGATGGGQTGNAKKFADMTSEERVALYRTDPKAYEAAKTAG